MKMLDKYATLADDIDRRHDLYDERQPLFSRAELRQLAAEFRALATRAQAGGDAWQEQRRSWMRGELGIEHPEWSAAEIEALVDQMAPSALSLQERVRPWVDTCFGAEIAADIIERNDRFIEEALELIQACGGTRERAHALVDYVFGRPVGEKGQEVGGVMVTLAALCLAQGVDMHEAAETELARVWTKIEQIRAKQAAKPRGSALPVAQPDGAPAWQPRIGEHVRIIGDFCAEWPGEYFIAGMLARQAGGPGAGTIDYTISEAWPPKHRGDLTDGWNIEDLVRMEEPAGNE